MWRGHIQAAPWCSVRKGSSLLMVYCQTFPVRAVVIVWHTIWCNHGCRLRYTCCIQRLLQAVAIMLFLVAYRRGLRYAIGACERGVQQPAGYVNELCLAGKLLCACASCPPARQLAGVVHVLLPVLRNVPAVVVYCHRPPGNVQ